MLEGDLISSLSDNSIRDMWLNDIDSYGDNDWDQLCQSLRKNKSLMRFSLYLPFDLHTTDPFILGMREVRLSTLLSTLEGHPRLQSFELSLGSMGTLIIQSIIQLITNNPKIQFLSLPENQLESGHLDLLFPAIHARKNLHALNFRKNWLQSDATSILKNISISRKLSLLDVSDNNLGNSAMQLLLMPASSHFEKESIDYLDLSFNHINKFGIHKLYKKLTRVNANVQLSTPVLCLNDNPISCMGGKTLARMFKSGFGFKEVYLRNTSITDRTVVTLCGSMIQTRDNPSPISVRILNLESTDIKFNGAAAVAKLIRESTSLEEITLSYDRINTSNKLIISEALRHNHVMKDFHLFYDGQPHHYNENRIAYNLGENILEIFRKNTTLEHIDFCGTWSGKDAKLYSDIILENFDSLGNIMNSLANMLDNPKMMADQQPKYLAGLNICNTFINRIDNYYNFDQYRGPVNREDPSKEVLLAVEAEFCNRKKTFHRLSKHISLYEAILKKEASVSKNLFDSNLNGMINDCIGNRGFHNVLLTNFMLEKSKQRSFLEEKEMKREHDDTASIDTPKKKKRLKTHG